MNFLTALNTAREQAVNIKRESWQDSKYVTYFSPVEHGIETIGNVPVNPFMLMYDNVAYLPYIASYEDTMATDWVSL